MHPGSASPVRRSTCRSAFSSFASLRSAPAPIQPARAVPNSVLINPEIEPIGEEIGLNWEGCLSIPEMRAVVPRALRIRYRGVDCDGNVVEGEATRFHARVMQHENDHLDGILYPMRVTDFRYFGFNAELDRAAEEQRRQQQEQQQQAADQ